MRTGMDLLPVFHSFNTELRWFDKSSSTTYYFCPLYQALDISILQGTMFYMQNQYLTRSKIS